MIDDAKLLRQMGWSEEQVAAATRNGKPLGQAEKKQPKDRYKSKAERFFAWDLEWQRKHGTVAAWLHEPASLVVIETEHERVRYHPDFLVVYPDGRLEWVEVKGFLRDDARKSFLAARARFPFWKFRMVRRTKAGGWETIL